MSQDIPSEVLDAILQQLMQGNKIVAVKLYKDQTLCSLADAKAAIDALSTQINRDGDTAPGTAGFSNEEVEQLLLANQKIEAVKRYKAHFNTSLVDAKNAVEAVESQLRAQYPNQFTRQTRPGCMSIVVLAVTTGGLVASVVG